MNGAQVSGVSIVLSLRSVVGDSGHLYSTSLRSLHGFINLERLKSILNQLDLF